LIRPRTTLAENYERDLAEEAILSDMEQKKACPKCQRQVKDDYIICPNCHEQLKLRCLSCGRLLDLDWKICPYCGQEAQVDSLEEIPVSTEYQQS
ncbi:MAG: zinc ribbon domain-containing protein, partial [Anaerolineae bacterium]